MSTRTAIYAFVLTLLAAFPRAAAAAERANMLEDLQYATLSGNRVVLRARFTERLDSAPRVFRLYHPRVELVLDFPAAGSAAEIGIKAINLRDVRHVQVIENAAGMRLVIRLEEPLLHEMDVRGNELWITLAPLPAPRGPGA